MVQHRILQFLLQNLLSDHQAECILFQLLDCIGDMCCDEVDSSQWDQRVEQLIESVAAFEKAFPNLMVRNRAVPQSIIFSRLEYAYTVVRP